MIFILKSKYTYVCVCIYVSRHLQGVFGTDVFLSLQRMDTTLSNMKEKVSNAQCALPLFTCLHVKPDVSELMFAGVFPICVESLVARREVCGWLKKKPTHFSFTYLRLIASDF